jgi:NAD(P)-dependent dehydrogenase (short-subunit alcohol dehydrogenase family)
MRFSGRRIVVTGVGREGQVGDTVARAFAAEGATLALVDRHPRITLAGATAYACDLTDPAATSAVAEQIRAAGPIHAIVNLAGGFALSGPIGASDPAVFAQQVAINLTTAYVATRAFLPLLADGGSVVYFSSATVLSGGKADGLAGYAAAKAGVLGLMQAVADEGKARRVRANAVAPTAIRTGDNIKAMGATAPYVEREAVADAVLFLCSDAARAITGQVFRLT